MAQRRADALGALGAGADRLVCGCGGTECPTAGDPDPRAAAVVIQVVAQQATLDARPDPHTSGEPPPRRPLTPQTPLAEALAPDPEPDLPALPTAPAAHLLGGGTLPAAMIAELIANGAALQPVRHPGEAPPEPGYRPSAALQRFLRCRDMTCRFPGCDRPAEFADIDHTIAYPYGPTHPSNLKCLCRKHSRLRAPVAGATPLPARGATRRVVTQWSSSFGRSTIIAAGVFSSLTRRVWCACAGRVTTAKWIGTSTPMATIAGFAVGAMSCAAGIGLASRHECPAEMIAKTVSAGCGVTGFGVSPPVPYRNVLSWLGNTIF